VSPLPTQMANHWWQRPGRYPGRVLYQWHLAFHDQPAVRQLARMAQARLAGQAGLDMIDLHLLHLTTYIVGFADEIPQTAVAEMVSNARELLADVPPIPVTLGRIGYHPQAVVLLLEPERALDPALDAVRTATNAAGYEGHTDTDPWRPHISVAYSHASGPAAPIIAALGHSLPPVKATLRSISLVSQTQVGRSWQWQPVSEALLTGVLSAAS
jgi:2'-5' RNA ligase